MNCAGIMAVPLLRNDLGYESQFATNHLGHFHLASLLWPALVKANGARVVTLSSRGHRISDIDFMDINFENRKYDKWKAYGQSKTANALFALELDNRGKTYGIRSFSVHAGTIITDKSRNLTDEEMQSMGALDASGRRVLNEYNDERKIIEEGAATIVWCATSKQLNGLGGLYCENVDIAKAVSGNEIGPGVRPWASSVESAKRLWEISEKLLAIKFPS
ncbi:SDR family NAD(P)-dependent oxidoreductase [Bacillus sp. AFS088145]|uniref:SDR family NAD(P)-dependent oxidoreductase n=1 Tax=Bacillus sp. AFS088145 TaxID=2033514 RepID=UPI002570A08A|nr:SDR family NAD(P)-dependent oxidoreductase [Bacillus sp. AFS088145]